MTELEQIERAIAALEGQRGILDNAVVETALTPLREKLAELKFQAVQAEQQRKQITVLFADVSGFTAMSETMDAEEVTDIINALWSRLDTAIKDQGGQIDKHIGDAVMALWGVQQGREDDPERAIRAALAMQAEIQSFVETQKHVPLRMRIGVNTGLVLLGEVGSTREYTAMGDTVNLASRMEHAAPIGGVLISHATYRQVRGVFDVQAQAPLTVKGKAAPVQTYIVLQAKPRAFRMGTRGVEGIETHMVGREAELVALQSAYTDAISGETRLALIVGEAGVGKSRLLFEFENWLDLRPESIFFFKGRASPVLQSVPYGLLRDMFAHRFDILETDSAATTLSKFRAGMTDSLPPERADLVGHLVGFDFSVSQAVRNLSGSSDFSRLAQAYLTQYFRSIAAEQPVVLFLEDLHWADDGSLALVNHVLDELPNVLLLVVGVTRPPLFETHPHWGEGLELLTRLDLKPLSKRASRELVDEILQKINVIPAALRDLIVDGAEGNPFYVEELVKMLIDDGVIERQGEAGERWLVNMARLKQTRVPPTLTGILQARLDSLPRQEREVLQCASVIGRIFWDVAVAELAGMEREQIDTLLVTIRERELIYWRERSVFAGTEEFLFKHALLRDAAYETVLLRLRRRFHAQAAQWLEDHAGERLGEYIGLIAEHLEHAGEAESAARYLRKLAEKALETDAYREALALTQRALALLPEDSPDRPGLLVLNARAIAPSDNAAARHSLEGALTAAESVGQQENCILALNGLAQLSINLGEYSYARACVDRSLMLAHKVGDRAGTASALQTIGLVEYIQGNYPQAKKYLRECQAVYEALGDSRGRAMALGNLSNVESNGYGNLESADSMLQANLAFYREIGARGLEAVVLNNLGEINRSQGNLVQAQRYYRESLFIGAELGDKDMVIIAMTNFGHVAAALKNDDEAQTHYLQALRLAKALGLTPTLLEILAGYAGVLARAVSPARALALLGVVIEHPALRSDTKPLIEQALITIRACCSEDQITRGLARGKTISLETAMAEILAEAQGNG